MKATFLFLFLLSAASASTMASDVSVSSLKTFCSVGKERDVLNGYQEAELLNHSGIGCLTHM